MSPPESVGPLMDYMSPLYTPHDQLFSVPQNPIYEVPVTMADMRPLKSIRLWLERGFRNEYRQCAILQHFLNRGEVFRLPKALMALREAIVVCLDVEWYEKDNQYVTEVAISILDGCDIEPDMGIWDALKGMRSYHLRVQENAHLLNTRLCPGRPDKFQFGTTTFATMNEVHSFLLQSFLHQCRDEIGHKISHYRPVILIGHALDNDVGQINEQFNVDLHGLGVIVATIDTQILAREAQLVPKDTRIPLWALLEMHGITEEFLHTAGNDSAYTLIAALLTAVLPPRADRKSSSEANREAASALKEIVQLNSIPEFGKPQFCTRCDGTDHLVFKCRRAVYCTNCAAHPARARIAQTHKTEKCIVDVGPKDAPPFCRHVSSPAVPIRKEVAIPCHMCIMSPNPKRWRSASNHLWEECFFNLTRSINNNDYRRSSA